MMGQFLPNQRFRSLDTINPHLSSIIFRVRAETELRQPMANQAGENGEVKSKRRIWRPLVKAVLIMDIVEATEDAVVAEVGTEDEDTEMASPEDEEDTAAEATRPLCSNCLLLQTS
jgi:hypothetical protein